MTKLYEDIIDMIKSPDLNGDLKIGIIIYL